MTLLNLTEFPPGGYRYTEQKIGWSCPSDLALQGIESVARALQTARAQNPKANLDPSYESCLEAIKRYTCQRFANDPRLLAKFCGDPIVAEAAVEKVDSSKPRRPGCSSCGARRK